MRVVQTPTQVIMLYELLHAFRVIPLNAKLIRTIWGPPTAKIRWATGKATRSWWT